MDDPRDPGFACAPGMRVEAHERLVALQFAQVAATLERIEAVMERLERRLWLAVYDVVAAIGAQAAQGIVGL
ncbi:GTA head formation protein, RCAP_rcc01685 family [Limimaricola cinnabarinus]|uniref:GTA head formation protein, RCAP_rcc01685 family n=1 Tax=Limimaricola cinnabarinus TaxID=1125964 RepID=UPI00249361D0|nr:hypothetical protein [Limimaricola cinnabarinus]